MSNLTILNSSIRSYENLYSLNDLHQVSGNRLAQKPSNFIRLDQTKELIAEIQNQDPNSTPLKVIRGTQGGTYACKELVIAYAAWISPAFHLTVLRAFLNQVEPQPKQIALPEPEKTYPFEFTEKEIHILSVVMDKYVPMVTEFCDNVEAQQRNVYTALGLNPKQNNPLAARAYSINHEFRYWTDEAKEIIQRINAKKNYALANF